jgi:hypothetical protein
LRRAPLLATVALAATTLLAGAAQAQAAAPQAGQATGLRYLSWTGRSAAPAEATPVAARADAPVRGSRRPNRVIPHGGAPVALPPPPRGLTPAPGESRRTLTPANAWMRPAAAPTPQPVASRPAPPPPAAAPIARTEPPARALPDYLPDQGGRGQPVPAEAVPFAAPPPASEAAADPMAPRRDAPIFRMRRPADAVAPSPVAPRTAPEAAGPSERQTPTRVAVVTPNPADRPPMQGARYYSVHRQAGHEPDPVALPEPTYVDALAVTLAETPASQDLAQPAEPPTLIRDGQGRLRAAAPAPDGDYQ